MVSWVCTLCHKESRLWAQNLPRPSSYRESSFWWSFPLSSLITCEFQHRNGTGVGVWFQEGLSFMLPCKPRKRSCSHRRFLPVWITVSIIPWKAPVTVGAGSPASSPSDKAQHLCWGKPCHVNRSVWALSPSRGFLLCERRCLARCSFLLLLLCRWILWVLLAWRSHRELGPLAASMSAAATLITKFPDGDSVPFSPS